MQPVRYIIKQIGNLMNHDIKEQLDKIEKDLQQHKVESWRQEILSFANDCMNHKKHTKGEFENGRVDVAYEYVKNIYMRRCEKNDFLMEREEKEE